MASSRKARRAEQAKSLDYVRQAFRDLELVRTRAGHEARDRASGVTGRLRDAAGQPPEAVRTPDAARDD